MSDKDNAKPSAPKSAAPRKPDAPARAPQEGATEEPPPTKPQTSTFANIPHQQAVEEGVKAAASIRQTTEDAVLVEREPVKAPPPHPLVGEMARLKDEVAKVAKAHKEEVLDLRDRLQQLLFKVPADMPGHSIGSLHSVATQIEEGINMLDPDISAKAPG